MKSFACLLTLGTLLPAASSAEPVAAGLKQPSSVAVGADGRVYVTVPGGIAVLDGKEAKPFATGMTNPRALTVFQQVLYAADGDRLWRIDLKGKAQVVADAKAFPTPPAQLFDIAVDETGIVYVSNVGKPGEMPGAIYRIDQKGKVSAVTDAKRTPEITAPTGLLMDSKMHLLVLDQTAGLHRVTVTTGKAEPVIPKPPEKWDGLVRDWRGRTFLFGGTSIFGINRPGEEPILIEKREHPVTDLCLDAKGDRLLVLNGETGTLTPIAATIPGREVNETPLPVATAIAFPDLQWTGWKGGGDTGKIIPLRPILLTHAGDGSNRVFVPTQRGVVHVFPNDQKVKQTKVFLDLEPKVFYSDNENEQGFLGMAFSPEYKKDGTFYIFYTDKNKKQENVISRFRVSKDDPDRADPAFEEEIFRIKRPFWNHDGGTIIFGPDGYLYIALGDGGAANDPFNNGQNLKTLLGTVLRIDVTRQDAGKKYAIPKDNPFVNTPDAQPEIWAYGLRNVWRMAFDPQTKKLWAGDVGQNLWEEINILTKGGNYGWNLREGFHPFRADGGQPRKDLIEPIWEYHHDVGKSITGGSVYRGKEVPELQGHYLYADYVTSRIWGLRYDEEKGRVVANRPIRNPSVPVLSFGEDEKGEVYFLTASATGQGIYRFVSGKQPSGR